MRVLALVVALVITSVSAGQAQAPTSMKPGTAVRVEASWLSDGWHLGTVRRSAEGCHVVEAPPTATDLGAGPGLGLLRFMTRVQVAADGSGEWRDTDVASIREPDTCVPMLFTPR